jgi:phosphotransferase system enzyme I (PtsI)
MRIQVQDLCIEMNISQLSIPRLILRGVSMKIITGIGVNGGIAIGPCTIYRRSSEEVKFVIVDDINDENLRYEAALEKTLNDLQGLYEKAVETVGEAAAQIIEVHKMVLQDIEYDSSVRTIISTQKTSAEYAVYITATNFSNLFATMDNEYMKERAADVRDASKRLLAKLQGKADAGVKVNTPSVLVADDLAPSETVQLDRSMILGFVTQQGSSNSHTAILARTMDIPAVVGAAFELVEEYEGKLIVVDGFTGKIYIDPEEAILEELREKQSKENVRKELLKELKGRESITPDGQKINIYANIGNCNDVENVIQNDAEGIGLFRSEFLYLEKDHYPTEEEQFSAYKTVVEHMGGKRVIIRTLDIGADKKVDYFELGEEENPALGYRAIRICLDRVSLFKTQLRAIFRASAYGTVSIMFPMIISLEEVLELKGIVEEVKQELKTEGIPYSSVELGIMIETPAAAVISDILAKEVDFFSLGTNDLTQYTLAIDRQNRKLERFYNAHHTAVLRLIEMVTKNAHDHGIWVGICGELASDLSLTEVFLRMGIDELSVSPGKVLEVRNKVVNYKRFEGN